MQECQGTSVEVRAQFMVVRSLSTMWVLGMELRLSGMVARAILMPPFSFGTFKALYPVSTPTLSVGHTFFSLSIPVSVWLMGFIAFVAVVLFRFWR